MMASALRYSAWAAMVSTISGYALLGEMPSQTVMPLQTIGIGIPIQEILPTEAPSLELVKKHLVKKAVTNTCSEWTITDGIGYTPICDFSETCLFTSATDGNLYEGCGQTSIAYNWITECWDYNDKTGLPPVSQTYCPSSAPYCGYFMFVYDSANTFYNFGCSDFSYSSTAYLVANSTTDLAAGGTTKLTEPPTVTATVTKSPDSATSLPNALNTNTPTSSQTSTTQGSSGDSSTSLPTIHSHTKKKAPIGAIVGGVVGGIAAILIAAFLIWFCLRKRKQNRANEQQQQADAAAAAAFNHQNGIPEMGGDPKPPTVFPPGTGYNQGAFNGPEKLANPTTQEMYGQPPSNHGAELAGNPGSQSPPPLYAQPPPPNSPQISTYPPSNFTELDNTGRQSVPPVSPVGTYSNVASPSVSELGGTHRTSELSGSNQPNYSAYNPTQELESPEMRATAPQVQRPVRQSAVDMNGAPLNETFSPHEMP